MLWLASLACWSSWNFLPVTAPQFCPPQLPIVGENLPMEEGSLCILPESLFLSSSRHCSQNSPLGTYLPVSPNHGTLDLALGPRGSKTRTSTISWPVTSSHVRKLTCWNSMASSEVPCKPECAKTFRLALVAGSSFHPDNPHPLSGLSGSPQVHVNVNS